MAFKSHSVMGRVRPRLAPSKAFVNDKSRASSKMMLPGAKRSPRLDYWEELLGSPDHAFSAEDQTATPSKT